MATREPSTHGAAPVPREGVIAERRLRAALVEAGFDVERDFAVFHPDVTSTGQGFVAVGRLSITTADRLAEVLEAAVTAIGNPRAAIALSGDGDEAATDELDESGEVPC
jgi:hypothetical protein